VCTYCHFPCPTVFVYNSQVQLPGEFFFSFIQDRVYFMSKQHYIARKHLWLYIGTQKWEVVVCIIRALRYLQYGFFATCYECLPAARPPEIPALRSSLDYWFAVAPCLSRTSICRIPRCAGQFLQDLCRICRNTPYGAGSCVFLDQVEILKY